MEASIYNLHISREFILDGGDVSVPAQFIEIKRLNLNSKKRKCGTRITYSVLMVKSMLERTSLPTEPSRTHTSF
jgi:hypothetical protein